MPARNGLANDDRFQIVEVTPQETTSKIIEAFLAR
jgi:hypothetical protein